jgi:hypothetical protein
MTDLDPGPKSAEVTERTHSLFPIVNSCIDDFK